MRQYRVSDVVHQSGNSNELFIIFRDDNLIVFIDASAVYREHQLLSLVQNAQAMFKPRVIRAWIYPVGDAELPKLAQSLK